MNGYLFYELWCPREFSFPPLRLFAFGITKYLSMDVHSALRPIKKLPFTVPTP